MPQELSGQELLDAIQDAFRRRTWRFTVHGLQEAVTERLGQSDIEHAIIDPQSELIEDYPLDPRGASCLILSWDNGLPIHIVVSYPPKVVVITVYRPDPDKWIEFRKRQ
jgi:Domain of unknown function (DUF4258)